MKNKFSLLIAPVVFCWCLFYLSACNSPVIGDKSLLNKGDGLNLVKDTLKLRVLSEFQKMVTANAVPTAVVGSLYDPYFGTTYAGFYAQYGITSSNIYFGLEPALDSVVLTLQYDGQYGTFTKPVDIYVYQVNASQGLVDTQTYFTNSAFQLNLPPLGKTTHFTPYVFTGTPADSVYILGVEFPKHLRIPLSASFGNAILLADSLALSSTDDFFAGIVRGLYVSVNTGASVGNGVQYFDLTSSLSKVTVYYHAGGVDSLYYDLPVIGAAVNHFDNIYANSPANIAVTKPPTTGSEQTMYVQAGGGVAGEILISNFDSIPRNIAINKAELVLSVQPGDTFPLPTELALYRVDDAGVPQTLEDQALTTYGGILVPEVVNGTTINRYRFNIPTYFQKLIKGIYRNNGLLVSSNIANTSTERVLIANSPTNKNYQITLDITYTKL